MTTHTSRPRLPTSRRALAGAVTVALVAAICSVLSGTTPAAAVATSDGGFNPVSPFRLLDTRTAGTCLTGTRSLKVTGQGGVPDDAAAVVLNVTAVTPWAPGHMTVWPTGASRPTTSSLNFTPGSIVPNAVTVKVGTGGYVDFYASTGCPQVVVDINGSFAPASPAGAGGFTAVTPSRLLDTRLGGQGPCVSGTRTLQVAGRGGVPSDATAADLNVTVTEPWGAGHLTVYPSDVARPTASNLNYEQYQTVANHVSVKLGSSGAVTVASSNGCPHLVVDVGGSYAAGTPTVSGGFTAQTPRRVLDTRVSGQGPCVTGTRNLTLAGVAGVPADAAAVVLNVTVTEPWGAGHLTVWPAGGTRPNASNLNFDQYQTVPNHITVRLGAAGAVSIYAHNGCPHVVVDVMGWYSAAPNSAPSVDAFTSTSAAAAPGTVAMTWAASDPDGDPLTCRIDADGNGTTDLTVTGCQTGGQRVFTLPSAGSYTPTVKVTDGNFPDVSRTTSATVGAATADLTYDIDVDVTQAPELTSSARTAIATAVARWSGTGSVTGVAPVTNSSPVIVRGVPNYSGTVPDNACGTGETGFTATIDDLRVLILVRDIDGASGTLAFAGPCLPLPGLTPIPRYGVVVVDSADLGSSNLAAILTHELAHVFGFGTLWDFAGRTLITGSGTATPTYNGTLGTAAYSQLGGTGQPPLESNGGDGTAEAHWLESRFLTELMTGYISSSTPNPLSLLTVAAIADLGFQVDVAHADSYNLSAAVRASNRAAAQGDLPVPFEPGLVP